MAHISLLTVNSPNSLQEAKAIITSRRVEPTIIVTHASFSKSSSTLIKTIKYDLAAQAFPVQPLLVTLQLDADDEIETYALDELNMTEVPTVKIFHGGKDISTLATWTIDQAITILNRIQTDSVRFGYANTVTNSNKEGCCVSVNSALNGYSLGDIAAAGAANLGLGCGNPLSFAQLTPGETVVDLGSGAGMDVFIAASKVGETGSSIGVDMTPEMLSEARKLKFEGGKKFENVDFRLGEIENLPIGDKQVDCVISNCVINLSSNKARVFAEIYRVLKPGGRCAISDVVMRENMILPTALKTEQALAC